MKRSTKKRLAIFASGSGTNAAVIMQRFKDHSSVEVALVVTNRNTAGVIERAESQGVDWVYIPKTEFEDQDMIEALLDGYEVDWIVLAGWLLLVPSFLIKKYPNRIVNIHPALLPKFGGKGMYGHHVHEAVKQAGESQSGITIHFVNEQFDEGKIIAQHAVSLASNDGAEDIEKKVRALELMHYSAELEKLILGR